MQQARRLMVIVTVLLLPSLCTTLSLPKLHTMLPFAACNANARAPTSPMLCVPEPPPPLDEKAPDALEAAAALDTIDAQHAQGGAQSGPLAAASVHRAGFVSILGVPNVGKSTLLNALLGERLSIMTSKAQTTRHRILGMLNGPDYQIVLSDTPGVVMAPQYRLQEGMMAFVRSSLVDADVVLLVVDIFQESFPDEKLLRQLRASPAALLVLVNKVDLLDPATAVDERRAAKIAERVRELGSADELMQRWRDEFPGATVLPTSARSGGESVDAVLRHVRALLPEHPPYYDKDQLTDRPEKFFAAEMLREAIFEHYSEEIPYSCECIISSFKESDELIRMRAEIFVSHESQKGIVIGKGGTALKKVGTRARARLESFFDKKVYLETRVKVKPNWRQDERALEAFGYI